MAKLSKEWLESIKLLADLSSNSCWIPKLSSRRDGYTHVNICGKIFLLHRVSYSVYYKVSLDYLENKLVLHRCNRRDCFNPEHLYMGTHKDNMQDRLKAGHDVNKNMTCCPQGHEYTLENTYIYKGGRYCKKCRYEATKRRREIARRRVNG